MISGSIAGIRIVVSPDTITPKRVLSADVPVSPSVRVAMDAWMREFFGVTVSNVIEDGAALMDGLNNIAHMNPRTYAALKKQAAVHAPGF